MTEQNTTGPRLEPDQLPDSPRAQRSDAAEQSDLTAWAAEADCDYAPRVSAYHDGEVSEDEARQVQDHVAGCAACAAQLAFFGRVSSAFEGAPAPHLAPQARERLQGLGDQFGPPPERLRIGPSADVRWVRRLTAVAAVLFIVAVGKVIYEQEFAGQNSGKVTPASNPDQPVAPSPQRVSENRLGGPATPTVPADGKGPAITTTDFVVGRAAAVPPTTGQAEKR